MSKKEMIKIEIKIRQWELNISMVKEQLGYLRDKYPTQHTEAFLHALHMNDDKITKLKILLEKL